MDAIVNCAGWLIQTAFPVIFSARFVDAHVSVYISGDPYEIKKIRWKKDNSNKLTDSHHSVIYEGALEFKAIKFILPSSFSLESSIKHLASHFDIRATLLFDCFGAYVKQRNQIFTADLPDVVSDLIDSK